MPSPIPRLRLHHDYGELLSIFRASSSSYHVPQTQTTIKDGGPVLATFLTMNDRKAGQIRGRGNGVGWGVIFVPAAAAT